MKTRVILATAALASAPLAAVGFASAAHAGTGPVTATTTVTDRLDRGYAGNNWASDTITRTVTVNPGVSDSTLADCGEVSACYSYTATLTDTGTAHAIAGQISPGAQAVPIKGTPSAAIDGRATITFHASSDSPDAALVPKTLTGNEETNANWVEQFFPAGTQFGSGPVLSPAGWSYTDRANCQVWVEASDISPANSGDITGVYSCPVLSGGHATVTANRATVTWKSTMTSTFQVTIVGPGKLNGRTAKVTKPEAVYSGMEAGHSYTVTIQPLLAGSPAGKSGKITFVTARG